MISHRERIDQCYCFRWIFHVRWAKRDPHTNASEEGQADVLLGEVSILCHPQDVFPRHQVQQEQHRTIGQMVLQL